MLKERSVGAIIFYIKGTTPLFLLLRYPASEEITTIDGAPVDEYWEFVKGHVESTIDTDEIDTLTREIREETGITNIEIHQPFREEINYHFMRSHGVVYKEVVFYLVEVKSQDVKLSDEHISHDWLPYGKAHVLTPFEKSKEVLKKANEFIEGRLVK
ncbi:MAG: Asymmetrical Bis(5'-nucleosyl)-tetraphosphatase [Parcubacteria group bacterium GW2011_GWA2_47_8]|nr:MAG: Asymmetrical Bis(5'-nucleosyl)-tetraphosphatase [Parcubacteria group bacterium GW2011_GWA2_47_8]OHB20302.1 MAG: hypothetical protein A2666_02030 [Parcubacteria group bacterium RIFCSPHIGHO2_01_FULL_47_10b]